MTNKFNRDSKCRYWCFLDHLNVKLEVRNSSGAQTPSAISHLSCTCWIKEIKEKHDITDNNNEETDNLSKILEIVQIIISTQTSWVTQPNNPDGICIKAVW